MTSSTDPNRDRRGYLRALATRPGFGKGQPSPSAEKSYPPTILRREEVRALLDACDGTDQGLRLRVVMAFLYRTGAWMKEALSLRREDLELTGRTPRALLHGATQLRARSVGLDEELTELLDQWLARRDRWPGELVFCVVTGPTQGLGWDGSQLRAELRRLGQSILQRRVHAQAFRYALAAEMIIEQWPLTFIQAQLGLSSIDGFRDLFVNLGIDPVEDATVAEVARTRPAWYA